jgi:hypothetical protein
MVEDTRITGKIAGGINSTFLVLIPKDGSPSPSTTSDRFHFATSFTRLSPR